MWMHNSLQSRLDEMVPQFSGVPEPGGGLVILYACPALQVA